MLKNWKALLGGRESSASSPSGSRKSRESGVFNGRDRSDAAQRRHSAGLDQFFASIRDQEGLSILDLAGASQANISFITSMGHRLYSDDVMRTLELTFDNGGDFFENQSDPERVKQFMSSALDFPEEKFGGALVWDTLQFLTPSLLHDTVDQLFHILQPGAGMLAFFHADERTNEAPVYTYRIADSRTLMLTSRSARRPAQFFNNRALEKLFARFSSVKFFLTRDSLREVIVKR